VAVAASVVALLAGSAAVALGSSVVGGPTPVQQASVVHDGLAAEERLALAFGEHHEAERLTKVRASRAAAAARPSVVWPSAGAVSGVYGERRGSARHPGLDIDGETGDPVWAAARGVVAWAGQSPPGYSGYGVIVVVDHGDGLQTLYAHLSAVDVSVGQSVEAGDPLGRIGTTGHVTGSHLHFEVRRNGVIGDPTTWLPARS
jgi:murein DD-endopeptidase MepM/ murein hydrolase activator NlpD